MKSRHNNSARFKRCLEPFARRDGLHHLPALHFHRHDFYVFKNRVMMAPTRTALCSFSVSTSCLLNVNQPGR